MGTLQIVAIVLAVVLVIGFLILTLFVTNTRKKTVDAVKGRLGADKIVLYDEKAHCFGLTSKGHGYLQTFGCLATTPDAVLFVQWSPKEELELKRSDILSVDESREHQGRDRAADLLVVRFRSPEVEADEETGAVAGEDAVAWQVDDIEAWKSELGR
jgi:hypothetical protein